MSRLPTRRVRGRGSPRGQRGESASRPTKRRRRPASPTVATPEGYSLYRVETPLSKDGWGYHYSKAHPSMRLEILDRIEVGDDLLLAELRMMGPGAYDWPAAARRFPNVIHIETHPEGPASVLYRVTFRTPAFHTITRRHRILTRYPIVVQNGISQFETFAEPRQLRRSRTG